ncbi:DUF4177 domain-containing protein [Clostridium sediminicola]|uniref:DUF4177 domain-containing protein n=1 Tax=Clostridium sediminicola TaxID=3114879 RepID=UPI0031F237DD
MHECKFVKVDVQIGISGMSEFKTSEDYHKIVEENLREGWRLLQIFAPPILGNGVASFFELIFEREVK